MVQSLVALFWINVTIKDIEGKPKLAIVTLLYKCPSSARQDMYNHRSASFHSALAHTGSGWHSGLGS